MLCNVAGPPSELRFASGTWVLEQRGQDSGYFAANCLGDELPHCRIGGDRTERRTEAFRDRLQMMRMNFMMHDVPMRLSHAREVRRLAHLDYATGGGLCVLS